ncbi:hypothetical protein BDV36DRAFT_75505 [Aspergillus pseudocaelatus]|uniref:Uncharacterized protein n=1 Tax=Aspergillus pseudocaelatus TaxID=1825620 RepID=A0ABQ6W3S6_9EURO|nr:hypothetical protein BDV36DRAFT_75505 [Aspergillus pseudocaelatus]
MNLTQRNFSVVFAPFLRDRTPLAQYSTPQKCQDNSTTAHLDEMCNLSYRCWYTHRDQYALFRCNNNCRGERFSRAEKELVSLNLVVQWPHRPPWGIHLFLGSLASPQMLASIAVLVPHPLERNRSGVPTTMAEISLRLVESFWLGSLVVQQSLTASGQDDTRRKKKPSSTCLLGD